MKPKEMNAFLELYHDCSENDQRIVYQWIIERPPKGADPIDTAVRALRALNPEELVNVVEQIYE